MARAGKYGEDEELAIDNNKLIVGFTEVPSLEDFGGVAADAADTVWDQLYKVVEQSMPEKKPRGVSNITGQLSALVLAMKKDDLVVLPRKLTSQIAVGRINWRLPLPTG